MSMSVGLFERFVGEMESLRAERVLDAAQAACAPHQKESWWTTMAARAQGATVQASEAPAVASGFMFNGVAVSFDALHSRLSNAIGSGVSN